MHVILSGAKRSRRILVYRIRKERSLGFARDDSSLTDFKKAAPPRNRGGADRLSKNHRAERKNIAGELEGAAEARLEFNHAPSEKA